METSFKLTGFTELDAALNALPRSVGRNALRREGMKALEPMAQTARDLAPDDPETQEPFDLGASIVVSTKQKGGRQIDETPPGPYAMRLFMGPTKEGYPQAVVQEFGSAPHRIKPKSGKRLAFEEGGELMRPEGVMHPGHPPHPYMRPAFERHALATIERFGAGMWDGLAKAAARLARKAARSGG